MKYFFIAQSVFLLLKIFPCEGFYFGFNNKLGSYSGSFERITGTFQANDEIGEFQNCPISNYMKMRSYRSGIRQCLKVDGDIDEMMNDESRRITDEDVAQFRDEPDALTNSELEGFEGGRPPLGIVLAQILGINTFTYILAALIVLFLSLNSMLGPGWLGQKLGIEGTGEYTEYGNTIPKPVNLNSPENLL